MQRNIIILLALVFIAAGSLGAQDKIYVEITIDGAKIFPIPSEQTLPILSPVKGQTFWLLKETKEKKVVWYQLELPGGQNGWLKSDLCRKVNSGSVAPPVAATATPAPTKSKSETPDSSPAPAVLPTKPTGMAQGKNIIDPGKNRFETAANGVVIDKTTGLEWAPDAGGKFKTWEEAAAFVNHLQFAERSDWRLPTRNELRSLWDPRFQTMRGESKSQSKIMKFVQKNLLMNDTDKPINVHPDLQVKSLVFWSAERGTNIQETRELKIETKEDLKKVKQMAKPGSNVGELKTTEIPCVYVVNLLDDGTECYRQGEKKEGINIDLGKVFSSFEGFGALAVRSPSAGPAIPKFPDESRSSISNLLTGYYQKTSTSLPGAPRYKVSDCGAVIDTKTKLEWLPDPGVELTWNTAQLFAESVDVCGHDDWRLPTIEELSSLFDKNQLTPCYGENCEKKFLGLTTKNGPYRIDPAFQLGTDEVWSSNCKWTQSCPRAQPGNSLLVKIFNFKPEVGSKQIDDFLLTEMAINLNMMKVDQNDPQTHIFPVEAGRKVMKVNNELLPPTYSQSLGVLVVRNAK